MGYILFAADRGQLPVFYDRSTVDSETEKAALEEALELVQQAKEKCRMVQEESMQALFTRGMKMQ